MTKRIISLILIALLAFAFASCENTEDTSSAAESTASNATVESTPSGEKTLSCTVDELLTAINGVNNEDDLFPFDEDRLLDDLGIKTEDFKEGFLAGGVGAYVENVAFFVCENKDQLSRMEALLKSFVQDIKDKNEFYNADNFQIASDAIVNIEGNYVYMVMSKKSADIIKVITDNLK